MKHFNLKKIAMMLALVLIIQNGAVIVSGTGSGSQDGGVAPCSDQPSITESYN